MLTEAVPAALGAALYPPALLLMAFLLVNPQPRKRSLVFLAGAALATLSVGFALVFIMQGSGAERGPHHRTVPAWVDLAVGIVLLGFALFVYFRAPTGPKAAKKRRELSLIALFGIGLFMYSPSPFYLAALHSIAKGHASVIATIFSVLLVAAIYMLVVEVPLVAHAIWPNTTITTVTAINRWLAAWGRTIIIAAAAVFGAYLVISALVRITG